MQGSRAARAKREKRRGRARHCRCRNGAVAIGCFKARRLSHRAVSSCRFLCAICTLERKQHATLGTCPPGLFAQDLMWVRRRWLRATAYRAGSSEAAVANAGCVYRVSRSTSIRSTRTSSDGTSDLTRSCLLRGLLKRSAILEDGGACLLKAVLLQ